MRFCAPGESAAVDAMTTWLLVVVLDASPLSSVLSAIVVTVASPVGLIAACGVASIGSLTIGGKCAARLRTRAAIGRSAVGGRRPSASHLFERILSSGLTLDLLDDERCMAARTAAA